MKAKLKVIYCDLHQVNTHLNRMVTADNDADTTVVPVSKAEIGMLMGVLAQINNDLQLLEEELTKKELFTSPESEL